MSKLLIALLPLALLVHSVQADYLDTLKVMASEQGALTPQLDSGQLDQPLIQLADVVCLAKQKNFTDLDVWLLIKQGADLCTPELLLLLAMQTALTTNCTFPDDGTLRIETLPLEAVSI